MKKLTGFLTFLATFVLTLTVFFNVTGQAQAAIESPTGITATNDSVDRIWMSFNVPTDHGVFWFYEYSLPGVGFRGIYPGHRISIC